MTGTDVGMTLFEIVSGERDPRRDDPTEPLYAVPLQTTPWVGFWWTPPTPDGYVRFRNPLTGRNYWVNRDGRVRAKEQTNG